MPDYVGLVRHRTYSGIVSFFLSCTGLVGCRTVWHSSIYRYMYIYVYICMSMSIYVYLFLYNITRYTWFLKTYLLQIPSPAPYLGRVFDTLLFRPLHKAYVINTHSIYSYVRLYFGFGEHYLKDFWYVFVAGSVSLVQVVASSIICCIVLCTSLEIGTQMARIGWG
jgi:hypothetical protein